MANIIDSTQLQALSKQAGGRVTNAIHKASAKTGVDFSYLMQQAAAESSFDASAKAKTSSATGLYQFIEKTWLGTVKKHGDEHGLSHLTKHIDDNGKVSDPNIKKQILNLRNNPEIASIMAAEFAGDNKSILENAGVRDIGATELYFAHFLGAGGASKFLLARQENQHQGGASIFPAAASANKNVFYNNGKEKSLEDIYGFFNKKFGIGESNKKEAMSVASNHNYSQSMSRSEIYSLINNTVSENKLNLFSSNMGGGWEALAKTFLQDETRNSHDLLLMIQEQRSGWH